MRKILVIGSGGAGKTTFARRLGELLSVEVLHLDSLYWNPGWVETPKEDWREKIEELVRRESWVMDGNYSGTLERRLEACDTVIFLDMPRRVCLWRVLKRWAQYRNRSRPDMAKGCREHLNLEFIRWVWGYPKRTRPKILRLLRESSGSRKVFHLRSRAEAEEFLAKLRDAATHTQDDTPLECG